MDHVLGLISEGKCSSGLWLTFQTLLDTASICNSILEKISWERRLSLGFSCEMVMTSTLGESHRFLKDYRKVHERLNACWKISCLAVNGQSFLVIDGYLLNLVENGSYRPFLEEDTRVKIYSYKITKKKSYKNSRFDQWSTTGCCRF